MHGQILSEKDVRVHVTGWSSIVLLSQAWHAIGLSFFLPLKYRTKTKYFLSHVNMIHLLL